MKQQAVGQGAAGEEELAQEGCVHRGFGGAHRGWHRKVGGGNRGGTDGQKDRP
eukprot:SAG11_NODE_612_length_8206_cov_4.251110_2_plen_53_part_00